MSKLLATTWVPSAFQEIAVTRAVWNCHLLVLTSPESESYRTILPVESPAASRAEFGAKAREEIAARLFFRVVLWEGFDDGEVKLVEVDRVILRPNGNG